LAGGRHRQHADEQPCADELQAAARGRQDLAGALDLLSLGDSVGARRRGSGDQERDGGEQAKRHADDEQQALCRAQPLGLPHAQRRQAVNPRRNLLRSTRAHTCASSRRSG